MGGNELIDRLAQLSNTGKGGTPQSITAQKTEPDLDLIQPRAMLGRVDKADAMSRVVKEFRARHLGHEHPAFALNAQVRGEIAFTGHEADQALGLMNI